MRCIWIFLISIFCQTTFSISARVNSEHDVTSLVESVKDQIQELEFDVKNLQNNEKLQWQVETFQKWFKDTEKCSRDLTYIFDGWTTIQRRQDGSENFHRNWRDYRNGFGNSQKEFFIGLKELHSLTTKQNPQELLILMGDHAGNVAYAKYDNLVIGDEKDKFDLQELGAYHGNAGDALRSNVGQKFTTYDQDNDNAMSENCANLWKGAWWFDYCTESHLNGPYMQTPAAIRTEKGIVWEHWLGSKYALKFVQMMIRSKA